MSLDWELLIDADMTEGDWQFSPPTTATILRFEQVNAPDIGRFALGQATVETFEFLDIKAYPARAESTRITLDTVGENPRRIAIRYRYGQFSEEMPNTWQVKIYGSQQPFEPPINPSAILLTLDPRIAGAIPLEEKGIPLGVATLNESGLVDADQLPDTGLAELVAANLEAVDALADQINSLPPTPTLESLGAEPAGAELRAKSYTDQKISEIVIPPAPTLTSLGAEPAGAELRAKAYVDQRFPVVSTPTTDIRINCGASLDYTAADGKIWTKDFYWFFGNADTTYLGVVSGTYDFFLFNQSRSGANPGFNYKIPVPNGNYKVELGFSENWHSNVNSRKFHVDIEGVRVLTDFDIRAQAGARYTAIRRVFNASVADSELNIVFTSTLDGAQINNIRVYSV